MNLLLWYRYQYEEFLNAIVSLHPATLELMLESNTYNWWQKWLMKKQIKLDLEDYKAVENGE